jgi:hypothetical protein
MMGRSARRIIAVIAGINPRPSKGTTSARNARLGNAWRRLAMFTIIKASFEL